MAGKNTCMNIAITAIKFCCFDMMGIFERANLNLCIFHVSTKKPISYKHFGIVDLAFFAFEHISISIIYNYNDSQFNSLKEKETTFNNVSHYQNFLIYVLYKSALQSTWSRPYFILQIRNCKKTFYSLKCS